MIDCLSIMNRMGEKVRHQEQVWKDKISHRIGPSIGIIGPARILTQRTDWGRKCVERAGYCPAAFFFIFSFSSCLLSALATMLGRYADNKWEQ